jgi:hypothetical protein
VAVTTAVSFSSQLPPNYAVLVDCGQASVIASVTAKTSTGFNVVLRRFLAVSTVTAGTFNVWIVG